MAYARAVRSLVVGLGFVLPLLAASGAALAAETKGRGQFDHFQTGFPLAGAHAQVTCETCHVGGQFKGTPRQCADCHRPGSRLATSVKPPKHIPTGDACDTCHRNATMWAGARYPHAGVAPGSCTNCHNNTLAPGKPANHVMTTAPCDSCHRTSAWVPAGFNHSNVAPGTCASCHNGTTATGKPGNHVATSASCDTCHRTSAWLPASFNHTNVAPGTCATCHNGTTATGKPTGHFVTTRSCDACHTTAAWRPALRYVHVSPNYKAHSFTECLKCHTTNNEAIAWQSPAYQPDCAGCHANKWPQNSGDRHQKTQGSTYYTIAELKNCAGSCHLYSSTGTLVKSRSGQHSTRGW